MIELRDDVVFQTKDKDEFTSFINEQDALKKQRVVEFKDWEMTEEGLALRSKKLQRFKTYPMRDTGMTSTLRLFGMPRNFYYEKSPTDMLVRDCNRRLLLLQFRLLSRKIVGLWIFFSFIFLSLRPPINAKHPSYSGIYFNFIGIGSTLCCQA